MSISGTRALTQRALISGISGQDGSYLAEFLLAKGYDVWGTIQQKESTPALLGAVLKSYPDSIHLHALDLRDASALRSMVEDSKPDEIYHLAAQTHVGQSLEDPEYTAETTGLAPIRFLEAVRQRAPEARFFQASSAEIFGNSDVSRQSESTPLRPVNPYAAAKAFAHLMTQVYRDSFRLFTVNGILFNHESPRRGAQFVTRKITRAAAEIASGRQTSVSLGNLDASRDWGFAGDYVEAMWLTLQHSRGDDYVIATGETHTVREFCEAAFSHVGLPLTWTGSGVGEKGYSADGQLRVQVDPAFFRPVDVVAPCGDITKIQRTLNWRPRHRFADLVKLMVDADREQLSESENIVL